MSDFEGKNAKMLLSQLEQVLEMPGWALIQNQYELLMRQHALASFAELRVDGRMAEDIGLAVTFSKGVQEGMETFPRFVKDLTEALRAGRLPWMEESHRGEE